MAWAVGDLAVCVVRGEIRCKHKIRWLGTAIPATDAPITVTCVRPGETFEGTQCGCILLELAGGYHGLAERFRKVVPDQHKACTREFVASLKRIKEPDYEPAE